MMTRKSIGVESCHLHTFTAGLTTESSVSLTDARQMLQSEYDPTKIKIAACRGHRIEKFAWNQRLSFCEALPIY